MSDDSVSGYEDILSGPAIPHPNNVLEKLGAIASQAAMQSVRTAANPSQAMIPSQMMNTMATNPGVGGDIGAAAGYGVAHPIAGGMIGQAGADSAKQMEGWFNSGGEKNVNLPEIMGQGAIGAGKGMLTKLGVGGAINMIPGARNFTANKLLESAKNNRGGVTKDYATALDALDTSATQSGRTADMGNYLMDLATNPNPPSSASQDIALAVLDEAGKRGIDLAQLSPKGTKEVQDIFDSISGIWHGNPANTGVSRAQSGVNDMDQALSGIQNTAFPEFGGINQKFQAGLKPFQNIGAPITNSKGNVTGTVRGVARMMDKPAGGATGDVIKANAPDVFGNFGAQVLNDASGFHQGVQLIGNILQRAAQMAGGVGAGYGIGKGLGGPPPPTP